MPLNGVRSASPRQDRDPRATAVEDFQWPPADDGLAIYDFGTTNWQLPQEPSRASGVEAAGDVTRATGRKTSRVRLRGVLAASALLATLVGWTLSRTAADLKRAEAAEPAVDAPPVVTTVPRAVAGPMADPRAATPAPELPRLTITATYPRESSAVAVAPPLAPAARALAPPDPIATARDFPTVSSSSAFVAEAPPPLSKAVVPANVGTLGVVESMPVAPVAPAVAVRAPAVLIRSMLRRYEDAYDRRDVETAATLWPSLDRRALTKAFASLAQQNVDFDRCDIDASGARGSAVCVGTVHYVPAIGRGVEKSSRITWTFDLTRAGDDWQIAGLKAK